MITKSSHCYRTSRRSLLQLGAALGATALLPCAGARARSSGRISTVRLVNACSGFMRKGWAR
jgi:uncharacterized protein (DUF1501 family)